MEYNPAAFPTLSTVGVTRRTTRGHPHQALNALTSVREELQGAGGISFEESQMMVNSGIDGCEQTLNHQCQVVINRVLESMVHTDLAAAKRCRSIWADAEQLLESGEVDPAVGLPLKNMLRHKGVTLYGLS